MASPVRIRRRSLRARRHGLPILGPKVGGLFLAFPAILLASLTLVAKDEGIHQAREDARGAALGATGLIGFAVVVATTAGHWPVGATLLTATLGLGVDLRRDVRLHCANAPKPATLTGDIELDRRPALAVYA